MYSLQYIPFHKLHFFNLKVRQCLESGTRNFSFYCPTKIQAQIAKYTVLCVNRDTSTVIGGGPGQNFRVQFSWANISQCSIPSPSKQSCQPILVLFFPTVQFSIFCFAASDMTRAHDKVNLPVIQQGPIHITKGLTQQRVSLLLPSLCASPQKEHQCTTAGMQANSHQLYLCIRNSTQTWRDGIPLL